MEGLYKQLGNCQFSYRKSISLVVLFFSSNSFNKGQVSMSCRPNLQDKNGVYSSQWLETLKRE